MHKNVITPPSPPKIDTEYIVSVEGLWVYPSKILAADAESLCSLCYREGG